MGTHRLLTLTVTLILIIGCASAKKGDFSSNIQIKIKSATLETGLRKGRASNCTVRYGEIEGDAIGYCITPLAVSGAIHHLGISSTRADVTPVTLTGIPEKTSVSDSFQMERFNLGVPRTFAGDDNIEKGGGAYNLFEITYAYIETFFQVASNYWHVRGVFVDQPPTLSSIFSACNLGTSLLTEMGAIGTYFLGSQQIRKGDILICIKGSATANCLDSEYQWVDSTGSLTSVRPASPKQFTGSYFIEPETCTEGTENVTSSVVALNGTLSSPATVHAIFQDGVKLYTVTASDGSTESGKLLSAALDITTSDDLFFPSTVNPNTATAAEVLDNITDITLKPLLIKNHRATTSTHYDPEITAGLQFSVIE